MDTSLVHVEILSNFNGEYFYGWAHCYNLAQVYDFSNDNTLGPILI